MRLLLSLIILLMVATVVDVEAQDKLEAKAGDDVLVNGIYPDENFYVALQDFSNRIGYSLDVEDLDPEIDLDVRIWVVARGVKPEKLAILLDYSTYFHVRLHHKDRKVVVNDNENLQSIGRLKTKGFDVSAHIKVYKDYIQGYGESGDIDDMNESPGYDLLGLVEAVVTTGEDRGGSSVGNRLLFTESSQMLSKVEGFLKLLKSDIGGESDQAGQGRKVLNEISKLKVVEQSDAASPLQALWSIFGDQQAPVAIHGNVMEQLEDYVDDVEVGIDANTDRVELLQSLAQEVGFEIEVRDGAMFLVQEENSENTIYRIFNTDTLLKKIEKDYEDQRTEEDVVESFHGDFRKLGGIELLVDALSTQLDNHNCSASVFSWGSRLIVVGSLHTLDVSAEVLVQLGWKDAEKAKDK